MGPTASSQPTCLTPDTATLKCSGAGMRQGKPPPSTCIVALYTLLLDEHIDVVPRWVSGSGPVPGPEQPCNFDTATQCNCAHPSSQYTPTSATIRTAHLSFQPYPLPPTSTHPCNAKPFRQSVLSRPRPQVL